MIKNRLRWWCFGGDFGSKHKGREAMDGFSLDLHVKKRERMIIIIFLVNENSVECVWVYGRFLGSQEGYYIPFLL